MNTVTNISGGWVMVHRCGAWCGTNCFDAGTWLSIAGKPQGAQEAVETAKERRGRCRRRGYEQAELRGPVEERLSQPREALVWWGPVGHLEVRARSLAMR